jgi:hypothetical protein
MTSAKVKIGWRTLALVSALLVSLGILIATKSSSTAKDNQLRVAPSPQVEITPPEQVKDGSTVQGQMNEQTTVATPAQAEDVDPPANDPDAEYVRPRFEDWKTIGSRTRTPTPNWYFEPKYPPGMTYEELDRHFSERFAEFHNRCWDIAKQRQQQGIYDLVKSPPKDAAGRAPENWMGLDEVHPEYLFAHGHGIPEGYCRVTWVPFDLFPDVYELWDESQYLVYRKGLVSESTPQK